MALNLLIKAGRAGAKKAKSSYDDLKKAQAKRKKEIEKKKPPSSRRDMKDKPKAKDERSLLQRVKDVNRNTQRVSDREKRRRDRMGSSGLKVGTEEALLKGFLGGTGIAGVGTLVGAGIGADREGKRRHRKQEERFRKMEKVARKAKSEGKKTFTYGGKEYSVKEKRNVPAFGIGKGYDYYAPVETKSKKPVKKAAGGMIKSTKTVTKKKAVSRNKKGMGTKWESKWG